MEKEMVALRIKNQNPQAVDYAKVGTYVLLVILRPLAALTV